MFAECHIRKDDDVFIEAKDEFYKQYLHGWFKVTSVAWEKGRFNIESQTNDDKFKMFRNHKGICCVVEHQYDKYGVSTWDSEKKLYRFIFVPVDLYAKVSR